MTLFLLAFLWGDVAPGVAARSPVLVAAGDIASCKRRGDEGTAALLERLGGTVATLGDHVYPYADHGSLRRCYGPSWGRYRNRTRPAIGNHDYGPDGAGPYFRYFGDRAGSRGEGYYSYELGAWHVVVLNSNCETVGGCWAGSPQERWLRADLAGHPARCTLAYWHHPRFSSDKSHGSSEEVRPFWDALYRAGADLVLNGHAHDYERFAPQGPGGRHDPAHGLRQIVVGTGGASHYEFKSPLANSLVRDRSTFGVLRVELHDQSYDWEFVPVAGGRFRDSGRADCHGKP